MKVIPAFLQAEHFADFADGIEKLGKAAGSDTPEVGFEPGERLFDPLAGRRLPAIAVRRVQVGKAGWQEVTPAPGPTHGFAGLGVVMGLRLSR